MTLNVRTVIDTNVVVSGLIFPGSVPAQAIVRAQTGIVLSSQAMRDELQDVFSRSKFARYAKQEDRERLASAFISATEDVLIIEPIHICRDPRDDKFLEAAVYGRADAIITGDLDLLALDPFHGVRILTPAPFLELE